MQLANGARERDLRDFPRPIGLVGEPGEGEAIEAREILFKEAIEGLLIAREQLPG